MKSLAAGLFLPFALCAAESAESAKALSILGEWLAKPAAERGSRDGFALVHLTKADAAKAAALLWDAHLAELRATRAGEMQAKVIRAAGREMKFETVYFGEKADAPAGGRSLFISLHGGGGAPASLNDSQWRNQVALAKAYRAKEGVYIAPRAPTNTWNLWHEAHMDPLFDRLIENCVALEGVNPDRVYVLGYSAGGDGVYQLAPRMSDRWAAASMMAGHPNETSARGLRNVAFALQVGELDGAYRRNKIASEWAVKLDTLKSEDPSGYEHFFELHKGKPHWMDTNDRKAVPWMEKFTRNPFPERIVWVQDDVTHLTSYWLRVPSGQPKARDEIVAERKGQTFTVTLKGAETVAVMLNDELADLDSPVALSVDGKEAFRGVANRTIANLMETLDARGDRRLMFSAVIP